MIHAAVAPAAHVVLNEAGVSFAPPPRWSEAPALARQIERGFAAAAELVGAPGQKLRTGGRAWESPSEGASKGVLHVQWIIAEKPSERADLPALVRAELDAARQRPRDTTLPRRSFELVAWSDKVEGKLAWGQIEYRNIDSETRTLARTLLFVPADGRLHEVRVDCVMSEGEGSLLAGDPLAPRTGCEAAMAGIAPLAPAELQTLGDVPGTGTIRVTGDALADAPDAAPRPDGGLDLGAVPPAVTPRTGPLVATAPPAANGGFSRILLIGGGLLLVLALAVVVGQKQRRKMP